MSSLLKEKILELVTDVENKLMVTSGKHSGGGVNCEIGIDIYTLLDKMDN